MKSAILVMFTSAVFLAASACSYGAPPKVLEDLSQTWTSWKPKTSTLEVECFLFQGLSRRGDAPLHPDQIKELIESLRVLCESSDRVDLKELCTITETLFPYGKNGLSSGGWCPAHLIIGENKARIDLTLKLPPKPGEDYNPDSEVTYVKTYSRVNGKEVAFNSFNRQISVKDHKGPFWMPTVLDFILTVDIPGEVEWLVDPLNDGFIRSQGEDQYHRHVTFEALLSTGFVRQRTTRHDTSLVIRNQFLPLSDESGVVLSRFRTTASFTDDRLTMLQMAVVTASQVGAVIDSSRFNVEAPIGTLVVKFPNQSAGKTVVESGQRPPMERVTKVRPDAIALTEEPGFGVSLRPIVKLPTPNPRKHWFFIHVAAIACFLMMYMFWRKRRTSNQERV